MKKTIVICIAALCILTISGCRSKYADKARLAEDYLNNELLINCTVVDWDFQYYKYGIMGGQRMYTFKCVSADGGIFTTSYTDFHDLTEETVARLVIKEE